MFGNRKFLLLTVFWAGIIVSSLSVHAEKGNSQSVYTVKQDGTGDFRSIQEGVDTVPSGSTLWIYEGIYNENVCITDKTINLYGVDRDACILQSANDYYHSIPLTIGAGSVENLTLYGYTDKQLGDNWILRPYCADEAYINSFYDDYARSIATEYEGYTVHIDQDYLAGRQLSFRNCLILSENNYCVGCGLRKDCSLLFDHCEFRAYAKGGNVLLHDSANPDYYGECFVGFNDCAFYNYTGIYFFAVRSIEDNNRINLSFKNNTVHTVGYTDNDTYRENRYNGCTLDTIRLLSTEGRLIGSGFSAGTRISFYTAHETEQFVEELLACSPLSYIAPEVPEGILVLWASDMLSTTPGCFPIWVENFDKQQREDGWCGSSCFYLTPDSSGNTLTQMNGVTQPPLTSQSNLPQSVRQPVFHPSRQR